MFVRGFRKTFGFRLFRYFAVIILILASLFTIATIYYQKRVITADLVKEGKIISSLLVSSMKTWIFAESPEYIRDSLTGIMTHGNIDLVAIYNDRGRVIYAEHRNKSATAAHVTPSPEFGTLRFTDSDGGLFYINDHKDAVEIICPVKMDLTGSQDETLYFDKPAGQKKQLNIGYVLVELSKEGLKKEMLRIAVRVAIGTSLGILAGLVVLYISVKYVTSPLTELTANLRRFGAGAKVDALPVVTDDEIGRLAGAFNAMAEDLRRREQEMIALQERLKESEKLEAIGRLSRGIAHDFNNILSTVQGSVYMLEKKFGDHDNVMYYVEKIRNSLSRSRQLLQSIVSYSKTRVAELHPVELNSVIKRMTPVLESMLGDAIQLHISLAGDDLVVMGDLIQIEQIIMNLAANAKDAMPGGGSLTIKTSLSTVDDGNEVPEDGARQARHAAIHVVDTGTGIDEALRNRIFDQFYSTKEADGGTGLGLSIVSGIVERHGGLIRVKSQSDHGTEFSIYLPLFENNGETDDNIQ